MKHCDVVLDARNCLFIWIASAQCWATDPYIGYRMYIQVQFGSSAENWKIKKYHEIIELSYNISFFLVQSVLPCPLLCRGPWLGAARSSAVNTGVSSHDFFIIMTLCNCWSLVMTRKTIPWHGMGGEGGEKGVRPTIQPAQYIYWKCNSVTRYLLIYFMSVPV